MRTGRAARRAGGRAAPPSRPRRPRGRCRAGVRAGARRVRDRVRSCPGGRRGLAGVGSDGSKLRSESSMSPMRSSGGGARRTDHGTTSGWLPRGPMRIRPLTTSALASSPPSPSRVSCASRPRGMRRRLGSSRSTMPRPRARAKASTVSGRVETFRSVSVRRPCQPSPAPRPNEMDARSATSSVTEARPPSTTPVPWDASDAPRSGRAVATSALRRPAASSAGRACASRAATPATTAAATLVPLTVTKCEKPSSSAPGVAVCTATPDATTSGLTWPPNACPQDENAAGTPRRPLPLVRARAEGERRRRSPCRIAATTAGSAAGQTARAP